MSAEAATAKAAGLSFWSGPVQPEPLTGGITNLNFVVADRGERFVVRVADDIPVHGIMRFNELAASRAAFAAGVSPEVVHAEPGALVLRFIDGATYGDAEVRAGPGRGPHRAADPPRPRRDSQALPGSAAGVLGVPGGARLRRQPA